MQKIIDQPTKAPPGADGLEAMALRATAWAGEPFLHEDEDPAVVLAPGTARRRALDEAIAEIESGRAEPTPDWKVRFALMLGLERVLSEKPPHLASGTELRRHQIDALAGMLTELIAANQREHENGNGHERARRAGPSTTRRTRTTSSSRATSRRRSRTPRPTRAPPAATASATRPRRARRSPPPASSRRRARSAS